MSRFKRHVSSQSRAQYRLSGGVLRPPKTGAESLALFVRMRQLKVDFQRRQAQR